MGKKLFQACIICLIFEACSHEFSLQREYYGKDIALRFDSDKTYTYTTRAESFIKTFNRGTWRQDGNKLILSNDSSSLDELPFKFDEFESNIDGSQIIVQVGPSKQVDWEQNITDVINVDMIVDGNTYSIDSPIRAISLKESFHSAHFRAYPKPNSLGICAQLIDTLRSKSIGMLKGGKSGMLVNLDVNPLYFSRVKLGNDTLLIINDRKIKWKQVYFERAQ